MTTITFITGANKGLGYETARRLTELGHTVILGARDPERGEAAAGRLGVRFVPIDVTDDASVAHAAADVEAHEGRVDRLINNAGIVGSHARPGTSPATTRRSSSTRTSPASSGSHTRSCRCCGGRTTRPSSTSAAGWAPRP